ncbi:MAG TPA: interleukin-like EMT inducer domain-containing protein, partial [Polyangiales bacterium]|nr:interleukin-like EMT inducer domain-containing protein [Polyangiales bacterium]
ATVLMYLTARAAYRHGDAVFAALAALFGTPLFWYMTRQPCFSHAVSAFTTALLLWVWLRRYGSFERARWFGLGLLCGLGMSVRGSAMVHAAAPGLELLTSRRAPLKERARCGALFAAGALLGFLPQMIAWKLIYGKWLTQPQGDDFMMWSSSRYLTVLFSTRTGWNGWHPLVSFGFLGLIVASMRSTLPESMRRLAQGSLLALAASAFLNGATGDFYGGWGFGGRRFVDCTIYVALGTAQLFALLGERSLYDAVARTLRVGIPAAVALLVGWISYDMSDHYLTGEMVDHPMPMSRFYKGALTRAFDGVYAFTGNLGSIPESWWFASNGGVSPERWDVSGSYEQIDLTEMPFPFFMPWVALAGYGDELLFEGQRCRWLLAPEGRFTFTQRVSEDLRATLRLAGVVPGTRITLSMDGHTLLETELSEHVQDYSFVIPKALVRTGSNFVRVVQSIPPSESNEIGATGVKLAHDVSARSAGWGVGMQSSFAVDGVNSKKGGRGLTMFWLDGSERMQKFDTFGDPGAPAAFLAAVEALPAQTPVALAVSDDASTSWSAPGDAAIGLLGGKRSLAGQFRASYALIGVKGAQPGSAIESFSLTHAVHATLGRPYSKAIRGTIWHELWLRPAAGAAGRSGRR